ncbi:polysaccharide biosynthesis protein [Flavobacterium tegetincola]|uniref:polysaccharide biosynthesis protein n=1 Tax=Flavobacterium tegetincola TaxID=150172 RepID=UPI0012FAD982|nr:nucleoside-diphosphate sugar epimerase/dehydratase [Flavobacterium tegetincola]
MSNLSDRLKSAGNLKNLGYLPRWIVLFMDSAVVIGSAILVFVMLWSMGLDLFSVEYVMYVVPGYLVLNLIFFWIYRTYSGIIRHSSFIDAIKLGFATFSTLAVLILINYSAMYVLGAKIFMNTGLLINFVISFATLFVYRILVKQTFEKYLSESNKEDLMRGLIYGSDENAIAVANALIAERPRRFKVVGFVDKNKHNTAKRILNLPIINLRKRVPVLMRSVEAEVLIIADKNLTKEEKLTIVDECLEFNYKVFTVPLISDWEDQKNIAKKVKTFEIQDLLERKPIVLDNQSISNQLNGKVILVTGAAGSIGSEIVRQIIAFEPHTVLMLDQAETPLHHLSLEIEKVIKNVKVVSIISDVRNREAMDHVFKEYRPQVVFHAAAYKHVPLMERNPAQAIFVNVKGTKNVADLACEYKCESFVMVSTDKAVNPSNVMGASKRIAEKYVQGLHHKYRLQGTDCGATKFITTRFGNVLGSNGSVVPLFTEQIANGGPITITHPDIIRYFMTIPEACQLVLEAGAMGNGGEVYIFDMGKPVKIIDLAHKMIRLAGFTPEVEIKVKIVGLRPGEKLYEELLNDTATTLPTHHEKIMIAQEDMEDFVALNTAVNELITEAECYTINEIVVKMKTIVPEFKSMNSDFVLLDK